MILHTRAMADPYDSVHTRSSQRDIIFGRKIEHDDSVIDNALPLPKDSHLKELSRSVRIESYGQKLTLIRALEVDIHLTVGQMSTFL